MGAEFRLDGLRVSYPGRGEVLGGITATLPAGELIAVAGPNGAGKSTLVGALAGMRHGYAGSCRFDGIEVRHWRRKAFARRVALVPQTVQTDFPFSAGQVVMMGRLPHATGMFEQSEDFAAVDAAMTLTDSAAFRDRDFRTLSGGERQRVILAAALAQQPEVLLLDEPTTFLDLRHQLSLYGILRERARQGLLVVTVTHDLNLAAAYADRVIVLRDGVIAADGAPQGVITTAMLDTVFGVQAQVVPGVGDGGRPRVHYGG